ncbi:MAG TPA: glutathione-independent formaldehyde dehydrogenase [Candidatus Saccharimonadales bacterium]|nr:glutathione-independent formaldehyde dehydrogenase [Candidatus Saccharimonadales bacterium]
MKAVVYRGKGKMAVEDVDDPRISKSTDAILKATSTAICGSDLHMYDGRTTVDEGTVLGHEIMGVIEEVGDAVSQLKPGDRVVLPFNIACGKCFNCVRGFTNACLTMNPEAPSAAYGYAGMGPYRGGQAQKVLVPYADFNALKLSGQPFDEHEDDYLMIADIFPTAWHATELAKVDMGSSVAIYGAGPVGLLSIMSARLRGASEIYAIDNVESRLEKAREMGAIPINFSDGKPSEQIMNLRKKNSELMKAWKDGENKFLTGVMSGIDAIGYQAHDFQNPSKEEANEVLQDLIEVVNPTGNLGIIGVFMPEDPGAPTDELKQGELNMKFGTLWNKGQALGTGQAPVKKYNYFLRDLVISGKADPGTIVTHHISIDEAPEMYERFDKREDGMHKIVINPNGKES